MILTISFVISLLYFLSLTPRNCLFILPTYFYFRVLKFLSNLFINKFFFVNTFFFNFQKTKLNFWHSILFCMLLLCFSTHAYQFSSKEEPCQYFSTQNNCCEFFAPTGVILQSDHQSYCDTFLKMRLKLSSKLAADNLMFENLQN